MAKDMHDCLNISCKIIGECHRFYKGSAPPCAKLEEEKPNTLQQLKAEISAIADSVEDYITTGADAGTVACIVRDLRKLSAI